MVAVRASLWPPLQPAKLQCAALGGQHYNTALNIVRTDTPRPNGTKYDFFGTEGKPGRDLKNHSTYGGRWIVLDEATTHEEAFLGNGGRGPGSGPLLGRPSADQKI